LSVRSRATRGLRRSRRFGSAEVTIEVKIPNIPASPAAPRCRYDLTASVVTAPIWRLASSMASSFPTISISSKAASNRTVLHLTISLSVLDSVPDHSKKLHSSIPFILGLGQPAVSWHLGTLGNDLGGRLPARRLSSVSLIPPLFVPPPVRFGQASRASVRARP